jgi:Major Facilitator Superfamily
VGNALSFGISAALMAGLPPLAPQGADGQRVGLLKGMWEGLGHALGHPVARALVIGLGFGVLFAAVDDVALVFLTLMRTRSAAGVTVFILGLLLSGAGGLLTGLAPALGLAALAQAVASSGNGLEVVATDTLVQRSVPRSHRGRVFGVVSAATLLGGAIARGLGGVLVDLTSARATFVIGGSGVLLVALAAMCCVGVSDGVRWMPGTLLSKNVSAQIPTSRRRPHGAPIPPARPRPSGCCSRCTATGAWAYGSSASPSSMARATRTWPSRCGGRDSGPGHQRLHLLHHADAAQAVLRALQAPGIDGRIYNAADESPVTAVELHALNGVPFSNRPAGEADLWHGIAATTRIRRGAGLPPLPPVGVVGPRRRRPLTRMWR